MTTTHHMPSATTSGRRPRPTIEIMSVVMLGVAFGVVYWGWAQLYGVAGGLQVFAGPLAGILGGPWLIAGVAAGLLVRRPGAALGAEMIAAAVEALLGNHWGATTLLSGFLQGIGVEIVLLVFLFRLFTPWVAALCGIVAVAMEMLYEWNGWMAGYDVAYRAQYTGWFMLSGAVVAGLGGWAMVRALAATGAVDGLAAGREHAQRSRV